MAHKQSVVPKLSIVAACVASAVSFGAVASNFTSQPVEVRVHQMAGDKLVNKDLGNEVKQQFPTYYIVQLESPSVIMAAGELPGTLRSEQQAGNRLNLQSASAQTYQAQLHNEQQGFISALQSRFNNVQVERSLQVAMNGLIVAFEGDVDYRAQLAAMPGVKAVFEHEMYHASMDASLELINQPEAAAMLGAADRAGEGVKVAVIDGGIRPENPMFASNGHVRPSDLPGDDYCATIDMSFCNDKLVLARYYTPTFAVHPSEYISPLDLGGHGTHVAGTAVGNSVVTNYGGAEVTVSGVAPGASLMVYKALFRTPTSPGGGSNIMLVGALEDAIADGADIVNNSWGGGGGANPASSPYTPIFAAAEEAGVLMVTAAGNDGFNGIGCPACAEPGIAVASTQTGRIFANPVDAAGLEGIVSQPGNGDFEITESITGPLMPVMQIDEANAFACEPLEAGSLEGHIAMVSRGVCAFGDKADNVQAAGAIGMILWNDQPGTILMSMPDATLPSVSITEADGVAILEALAAAGGEGTGTINPTSAIILEDNVDMISSFSSRGPNGDSSFLKPDMAAPGSDILSAYSPDSAGDFNAISGTSMASPHVAGAAALLLQQNPGLNARELKSMLMSSTTNTVVDAAGEPASPFDRGAGRLDVAAALETAITFDGPSINSNACMVSCTFNRTVTNQMPAAGTWRGTVSFMHGDVYSELSSDTVELDANGEASFSLMVDVSFAEPGWKFGEVVWTDTSGQFADARMPIVVNAGRSDDTQVNQVTVVTDAALGEPMTLQARAGDSGATQAISYTVHVPDGTTLDTDSIMMDSNRAEQFGFSVAQNERSFSWAGNINDVEPTVTMGPAGGAFPFAGLSLTDLPLESPEIACPGVCDEITVSLPVSQFGGLIHNGVPVNDLYFSENGLTTADNSFMFSFMTHELPGTTLPNNVIAPFWGDFEFGDELDARIIYNIINDGTNDWLVIEWNNVAPWNQPEAARYSFAQWMKLGTDEIYFNYIDIPNMFPATIGIENNDGTVGATYFRNGAGTYPSEGTALRAGIVPGDTAYVEFTYDVVANYFGRAQDASLEVSHNSELDINMNGLFTTSMDSLTRAVLDGNGGRYESVQPLDIAAEGEVTVEIVEQPENGTVAAVTNNEEDGFMFTYTPVVGTVGAETFTYRVVDEEGNTTNTATVTVNVVNSAPVAVASSPNRVDGNTQVTLNASESSDADGDSLTYSWVQTSGPDAALSDASSASPTFTAPNENASVSFEVTVSDGLASSTASTTVAIERQSSGKSWYEGNFGAMLALLGLPLVWLRRRSLKLKR
ncbi:MAG: S8 family serine peptidase [Idiomarina sp.]|nr:S8 family serine peptidase [Idiomarina sp.]